MNLGSAVVPQRLEARNVVSNVCLTASRLEERPELAMLAHDAVAKALQGRIATAPAIRTEG